MLIYLLFLIFCLINSYISSLKHSKFISKEKFSVDRNQKYKKIIENNIINTLETKIPQILFRSFITNRKFQLQESFEECGSITSLLSLKENGDIIQHDTYENYFKSVRGKWSIDDHNILKMIMERTYNSKNIEYRVESNFFGVLKENSNNLLFVSGIIQDDESNEYDKVQSEGSFVMIPTSLESLKR